MATIGPIANFAGQLLPLDNKKVRPQLMFDAIVITGNIVFSFAVALISILEDLLVVIPQCQPRRDEMDNRMAFINRYCDENMGNLANISGIVRFRKYGSSLAFVIQGLLFVIPFLVWKIGATPKLRELLHEVRYAMTDMCSNISAWRHRNDEGTKTDIHRRTDLYNIINNWLNANARNVWKLYIATQGTIIGVCGLSAIAYILLICIPVGDKGHTFWSGPGKFECKVPDYDVYICYMNDSYSTKVMLTINIVILVISAVTCIVRMCYVNMRTDFGNSFLRNNLPQGAGFDRRENVNVKEIFLISEILEFNSCYMDQYGYWLALNSHEDEEANRRAMAREQSRALNDETDQRLREQPEGSPQASWSNIPMATLRSSDT